MDATDFEILNYLLYQRPYLIIAASAILSIGIQAISRELSLSSQYELITILIILCIQYSLIVAAINYQIKSIFAGCIGKRQLIQRSSETSAKMTVTRWCIFEFASSIICLIFFSWLDLAVVDIWYKSNVIIYVIWILGIHYYETHSLQSQLQSNASINAKKMTNTFHEFMNGGWSELQEFWIYLTNMHCCEELLAYMDVVSYIDMWLESPQISSKYAKGILCGIPDRVKKMRVDRRRLIVNGYMRMQNVVLPKEIIVVVCEIYEEFYGDTDVLLIEHCQLIENIEFQDEIVHLEHILNKYIYDSARMQIHISSDLKDALETTSPGCQCGCDLEGVMHSLRLELLDRLNRDYLMFENSRV